MSDLIVAPIVPPRPVRALWRSTPTGGTMTNVLNTIVQYQLSPREAAAYKLAVLFDHMARKMFPHYRFGIPGRGDPRKSVLFKHCWKMLGEVGGKIPPDQYRLFVYAQLAIFKAYVNEPTPPVIAPHCLNGVKAWNRWLVFKKQYDQQAAQAVAPQAKVEVNTADRVVQDLTRTKKFLVGRNVGQALEDGSLRRWVALKQVSPYYVWLSPAVDRFVRDRQTSIPDLFGLGMNVYRGGITDNARNYFAQEFRE